MPCKRACALTAATVAAISVGGSPCRAAPSEPPDSQPAPVESFDVWEIRVLGNSVLQTIEVERAVYASLGPKRSFKDVERARDALVKAYRSRGYGAVFVDIPEQEVKDGLVRLRVTEGHLDRVRLMGARYFANGRIRAATPALNTGRVLNTDDLQNQLGQVNRETPDRTVVPILRAGRTPGTVDVDLKVKDELPLHASVDVNNRYTANTSPTRVGVNLSYDNLFQALHSLSLQYQTAPATPSQARVWAATYAFPLGDSSRLALYAVDTSSNVSTVGTLSVLGAGRIYGMRYIVPLPAASSSFMHSFSLGPDYKEFRDTIRLTGGSDLTPIHYAVWSGTYTANLQTPATLSSFTLTPTFGIRGLVNETAQFDYKRYNAKPNFLYWRASLQHERPLLLGTRLFVRFSTQLATAPLISNEQMSLGGADTLRGYLEADVLGDEGANGSVEWRAPSLASLLGDRWSKAYLFSFFDAGFVRTLDPLPSQTARTDLSSWGFGFRIVGLSGLQASFDWARPRKPTTNTAVGVSRVNFDFSYGF